jgi:RNA-directed DNA polymerase
MYEEDTDSMTEKSDSHPDGTARNAGEYGRSVSSVTADREATDPKQQMGLIEEVVSAPNMRRAYKRVVSNGGAPGVDSVRTDELADWLGTRWEVIKEQLRRGRYRPAPVRVVEIPKPGGGQRMLGIPTAGDRLIQQALAQVLSPIFEPGFSDHSYGFRPGRNAGQAVCQARSYIEEGRRWVVDIDLEKFFDRVNHDVLMARVARKVKDNAVLRLVRRYLEAGMMVGGVVSPRGEGTPQGSPLSPLLSNILLDELDSELEYRGHAFCRYADDFTIYVKSRIAGQRVLDSVTRFAEKRLRLKVNRAKSAVDRPWNRTFLGYSVTMHHKTRLKIAPQSVQRLRAKLRDIFRTGKGQSITKLIAILVPVLRGWMNYFRHTQVRDILEELDGWIRRKLRCVLWRQWKRAFTRAKRLMKAGLDEARAWMSATNGRGPWWNAGASHMNQAYPAKFFESSGLIRLTNHHLKLSTTS